METSVHNQCVHDAPQGEHLSQGKWVGLLLHKVEPSYTPSAILGRRFLPVVWGWGENDGEPSPKSGSWFWTLDDFVICFPMAPFSLSLSPSFFPRGEYFGLKNQARTRSHA